MYPSQLDLFSGPIFPFFVLFVVFLIFAIIYTHVRSEQRRTALREWAGGHGLAFEPDSDRGCEADFAAFECLRRGYDRYAFNRSSGTWHGRPVRVFDYHYATTSTDSDGSTTKQPHYFTAAVLASAVSLRPLVIRPEGFFDRVTAFFGADDIDFESAEFSSRFHVSAADRKWAYDVLHPRTIEFLLQQDEFHVQLDDRYVMAWNDTTLDTTAIETALGVIEGILDRLPEYVVEEQRRNLRQSPEGTQR